MTEFVQARPTGGGKVLGFPLEGIGLFTSLLLAFASAFFTFFASTCIGGQLTEMDPRSISSLRSRCAEFHEKMGQEMRHVWPIR